MTGPARVGSLRVMYQISSTTRLLEQSWISPADARMSRPQNRLTSAAAFCTSAAPPAILGYQRFSMNSHSTFAALVGCNVF